MSGGGGSSRTTQTVQLDPVQRQALQSVISKSERLYNRPLDFYPGQTLAPEAPATQAGRQLALQATPGMQALSGLGGLSVADALTVDAVNDPRTQALADAATAPIEDRFREQTLPQISAAAVQQGAFGGARQGITESIAAREMGRAVGETRAKVIGDAYRQQLAQRIQGLSLLPQTMQASLMPAQTFQNVGQQEQERRQAEIDANRERFEFEEFEPESRLDRFASRVSGINLGGTTTGYTKQSGGGLFGK